MSIASEITRLQTAKTNIAAAIAAKGVAVPGNAKINTFHTYINSIPVGNVNVIGAKGIGARVRVTEAAVNAVYLVAGIDTHGENTVILIRDRLYGTSLTTAQASNFSSSSSVTGYSGSTLDGLCNTTIFGRFSSVVQNRILNANIACALGANVTTIQRKCFSPSNGEIMGGAAADGPQLPIFGIGDQRERVRLNNASTFALQTWWTRSLQNGTNAYNVVSTGNLSMSVLSTQNYVLPAFVIPADTPVSSTINSDGTVNIL